MTLEAMKCGACGADTARVEAEGSPDWYTRIELVCTGCKSRTVLVIERPRIEALWGDRAEGVFCTGWAKGKDPF